MYYFHFPSKLSFVASWDQTYTADLTAHALNPTHTGTAWFAETLASSKILDYLRASPSLSHTSTSFLDLGCGNGELLFMLRLDGGFEGRMLGIDYSTRCIELARRISDSHELEYQGRRPVEFQPWDIMGGEKWTEGQFDVVLDKGTFDAVSLSEEVDGQERRVCESYREKVEGLVKTGGLVLVTSCNWTEQELRQWFEGVKLAFVDRIEYSKFSFGGRTGQSVSSCCFRKTNND